MHETFGLDAQVDKCAKVGDIRHDTRQHHADFQVVNAVHALLKLEHLRCATRISARFVKFCPNIMERGEPHFGSAIAFEINLLSNLRMRDERLEVSSRITRHLFHQRIAFGVHGGVVERVLRLGNTQETCALFKGFRPKSGDFQEFFARSKRPMFGTIIDNVLRQCCSESADIGEEMGGSRVEIHPNSIHAVLYGVI